MMSLSFAFLAKFAYLFSAFAPDAVFSTSVGSDQTCESSATVHGGGGGGLGFIRSLPCR